MSLRHVLHVLHRTHCRVSFCTARLWIARQPLGWISPLTSVKMRALFDVGYELSGATASDIGQRE